jgi:hypothetical protein
LVPVPRTSKFSGPPSSSTSFREADKLKLGKIQQVDLREVWPNEASSFTPWLEQNPQELGEILGLDLEFVREKPVGKFSLDLFGTDLTTGRKVIVENQLEVTNHGHLGQLLTYAGGVEPSILVWVAKSIRQEHRAALEWLNSVTGPETLFFGIEVKAVRIGDSDPAPMLDIVVEPNSWAKNLRSTGSGSLESEKSKAYSAFWRMFIDQVSLELPEFVNRTAWSNAWLPTGAGISSVNLNLVFSSQGLRVEIYFGNADADVNQSRFDLVFAKRAEIEKLAGENLGWETLDGKKACRISFYGPKGDVSNKDGWAGYIEWFANTYTTMKKVNGELVIPALKA